MTWIDDVEGRAVAALEALADPGRAEPMAAYMKRVAPFLGVAAPQRRQALRAAWRGLPSPTSDELGAAAAALMHRSPRELHYAACDLIAWHRRAADATFLARHVEGLLGTKPWWDTVDALVSAAVSPLCHRFDQSDLVAEWSASGDRWLVRAAITHQRGWKLDTDVPHVLALCDAHWHDREFFVAKAIGWALRDIAAIDAPALERFLTSRQVRNTVAEREARRGLARAVTASSTPRSSTRRSSARSSAPLPANPAEAGRA